ERPTGTVNVGQRSVVARVPLSTPLAARPPEAPVELEDVSAARPLMEAVDVLRDHHDAGTLPLQLRNEPVPRVRLAASDEPAPIVVELPDPARVPIEGGLTGVRLVVVLFPDPSATPIGRHAALRGHARSGEEDDVRKVAEAEGGHPGSAPGVWPRRASKPQRRCLADSQRGATPPGEQPLGLPLETACALAPRALSTPRERAEERMPSWALRWLCADRGAGRSEGERDQAAVGSGERASGRVRSGCGGG